MNARIATVKSVVLNGLDGTIIDVETHVGRGLVSFTLVGLPDAALREAKDRIRSALQACGLEVLDRHVTVGLSPAGLPKSGSSFDLAIAASLLLANDRIAAAPCTGCVILGELALDGSIRPIRGILPALLAAQRAGITRACLPEECCDEARLVPGMTLHPFAHLCDFVTWAGGSARHPIIVGSHSPSTHSDPSSPQPTQTNTPPHARDGNKAPLDLADIRGQEHAIDAAEVAAAGGHHLFLTGEPGSGKTMLASRIPTILPPLEQETALTATALHSLAGTLKDGLLIRHPPFQAPHHSITMPALIGGGSGVIRPGAASLAHGGVLFLDEAAEFTPSVLDALRQPLESGTISVHRARTHVDYPASFQLILASNPCPCGSSGARSTQCRCTSLARRRYRARLSGPLTDRIDITVTMHTPTRADLRSTPTRTTATVKERVREARDRACHRLKDTPWTLNRDLPGSWIRSSGYLNPKVLEGLEYALEHGRLSMRGIDRVARIMLTLADLDGRTHADETDLARALALRNGEHDAE